MKSTNTKNTLQIILPDAEDLDTAGTASDYRLDIFLVPASENNGIPQVVTHGGVGNIGTPIPAWHNRWKFLAGWGSLICGQSALDALEARADQLIKLAQGYQGSTWDGHNHRGSWSEDCDLGHFWADDLLSDLTGYWQASEWLADSSWVQLCQEAGVDPEREDDQVIQLIADMISDSASGDGVKLDGAFDAVDSLREFWRFESDCE